MLCPACQQEGGISVDRTVDIQTEIYRQRSCRCGASWKTVETLVPRTLQERKGVARKKISPELKAAVLERDGGVCRYCGTSERLGIDHVVPLSAPIQPGVSRFDETERRNGIDNLCACCWPCNQRKGDTVGWTPASTTGAKRVPAATRSGIPPTGSPRTPLDRGGVGGGLPSGSDLDPGSADPSRQTPQDHPRARDGYPDFTPAPPREVWNGYDWQRKYGISWCRKYGQQAMAGSSAAQDLGDLLDTLSKADRLAAQARSDDMFAEFLRDDGREVIKARHPFSWFVARFNGLRVPEPPTSPGLAPRLLPV